MSLRLQINSASRTSTSTSSSNFTVNLPNPVYKREFKYIKLAYCMFFNTIYNITSSNNQVDIKISGVTYTATVPAGTYNANTSSSQL